MEIGSVELDFFRNAHIENIYIEDQKGDTMIYLQTLDCSIDDLNTHTQIVWLNKLEVGRAKIKIGKHKGEKDNNIDFLVDYFNPPKKVKRKTPKKVWSIYFEKTKVDDTYFEFFNETKPQPEPGLLDEYHLQFSRINATLENFWLVDDSLNFHCHQFSAVERSGLFINSMTANCIIFNNGMDFTDLSLETGCSKIGNELHLRYPGYKNLDEFVSNTRWRGQLKNTSLCLSDLSVFSTDLNGHRENIAIDNATISGTFDHLKLGAVKAKFGKQTQVNGNFEMQGLPDWRTTHIDFDLSKLSTNKKDLEKLLNGMQLPETLDKLGNIEFKGTLGGRFLDFISSGEIVSDLGLVNVDDLHLSMTGPLEEAKLTGNIYSENFNLQPLAGDNLGNAGFNAEIDVTGFTEQSFKADIKTDISRLDLMNETYHTGYAEGTLTAASFSGKAGLTGENSNMEFNGDLNFNTKVPNLKFKTHLENFNLAKAGVPGKPMFLTADVEADLKGKELSKMLGTLKLEEVRLIKDGNLYDYSLIDISKTEESYGTNIAFDGDLLNGSIKGRLDVAHFTDIIQNSLAPVFPNKIDPSKYKGHDSLDFDLHITETRLLSSFIDPELRISKLDLKGNLNSRTNIFKLRTRKIDSLNYGGYSLRNFRISASKPNESFINFVLDTGKLYTSRNQLLFKDIVLKSQAQPYFADLKLNFAHATNPVKANLVANTMLFGDSIPITFSQTEVSNIIFGNDSLNILENSTLVFDKGKIYCRNIVLSNTRNRERIELDGTVGKDYEDLVSLRFNNIGFDKITPFIPDFSHQDSAIQSFNAKFSGDIRVNSLLGNPEVEGILNSREIIFDRKNWGNLTIKSAEKANINGKAKFNVTFDSSSLNGIFIAAGLDLNKNSKSDLFNLDITIPQKNLKEDSLVYLLNPFLKDIVYIKQSKIYGQLNIAGNLDQYQLNGLVYADSVKLRVDYLNTYYTFNSAFEFNKTGIHSREKIKVHDETGKGTANVSLNLKHQSFKNASIDLRVTEVKDLKCLNTTEKMNNIFYGQGYANGSCTISGPFDRIDMDITLTTRPGTDIKLLYSDVEENKSAGFIRYETRGKKQAVVTPKTSSSIHRINIELNATPDAKAEFIIDPYTKDIIAGTGTGLLKMLYDENQNFSMWGNYTIASGKYSFSIPYLNIVKQELDIERGGTLKWQGDPLDCVLDVTGSVTKSIVPNILMESNNSSGTQTSNKTYLATEFVAKLNMSGNLFSPKITFDLDAPKIKNATDQTNSEVYAKVQQIRNNPDETSKQVMALIVTGNFFPTGSVAATNQGIAVFSNTLGSSLSVIANNVLGKYLFESIGLKGVQINVGLNQLNTSNPNTFQVVKFSLEKDWRWGSVNLNYNYGFNVDFNIKLNEQGTMLKVFSRPSNFLQSTTQNGIGTTTTQTGQTIGTGIAWRREFEKNVFRK